MTLRTASLKRQHQAWTLLALIGLVAYIALVLAFDLGNPLRFFGSHQMRVFLPLVILLRWLAHECRWDGIVREEEKKVEKADGGEAPADEVAACGDCDAPGDRALPAVPAPDTCAPSPQPQPSFSNLPSAPQPELPPSGETAEELWKRAREMVHNVIPDPDEDAEYLDLVFAAAELGYVPALAKLGEYAFRRGDLVEAYFWTKIAHRHQELQDPADVQALKEIDGMLFNIRRAWSAADQPPEFENVYACFPEERGELGRAFLRLDTGAEVRKTREYIQFLADKGNPDAALFMG